MNYTVQQLADLAGVSVRTLHHYDQIDLLKPQRLESNGYRSYGEKELLKLQQILFFRELEFPLEEIAKIIEAPGFDMRAALADQRKLIELKKKRLTGLINTIDKTLDKLNQKDTMEDQELYGNFDSEEMDKYAAEAKQRWGNTDAYKQSQERVKKMGKAGLKKAMEAGEALCRELAAVMDLDPTDDKVQALIARHYDGLRNFYEPNLEIYRGLAEMYVADVRFTAYYEKFAPGLATFLSRGMMIYCERMSENK
ncbi:MerR family transcriptional regulator [Candidatus Peregrinibacteria bacterium]|nr:MerR family transcriptional regulator [Candidatus Peregrinibacteria bacterium]